MYVIFCSTENFNWEKVNETTKLLSGYHDFRTFMGRGSHYLHKITRRDLKIKIINGFSGIICDSTNYGLCNSFEKYDYFNFIFQSKGFLYNQVSFHLLLYYHFIRYTVFFFQFLE